MSDASIARDLRQAAQALRERADQLDAVAMELDSDVIDATIVEPYDDLATAVGEAFLMQHPQGSLDLTAFVGAILPTVEQLQAETFDEAKTHAIVRLRECREAGGLYGQQMKRPSNFGRAADYLRTLPNPYRKADQ